MTAYPWLLGLALAVAPAPARTADVVAVQAGTIYQVRGDAVIEGGGYEWPVGTYVDSEELGFHNVMMAMETTLGSEGVTWQVPSGTDDEMAALRASYEHLIKLRDEVIEMGVLPAIETWGEVNPNLAALVTT